MADTSALLLEMTERLLVERFGDAAMRRARSGHWLGDEWDAAVEQGLLRALVEGEQGFDIPIGDGLQLIRLLGKFAVPLPLAETMIANAMMARVGLPVIDGVVALVPEGAGITVEQQGESWRATGEADRIAWGRHAAALLVEQNGMIGAVGAGFRTIAEATNLALMPRDRVAVDASVTMARNAGAPIVVAASLARALAMAGALETVLALTIGHVTERVQFGRPLSDFQAVQHSLARLASEATAASAAADLAAEAFATESDQLLIAVAAARSRIAEAAGIAIGLAHQLHGAIGFTEEHRLHWFTTALWSWRDEFGAAAWWTRQLGATVLTRSKADYWPLITSV